MFRAGAAPHSGNAALAGVGQEVTAKEQLHKGWAQRMLEGALQLGVAAQEPGSGHGSLKGSRGCSNSSCHLVTEADGFRDSHQHPAAPSRDNGTQPAWDGGETAPCTRASGHRAAMGGLGQSLAHPWGSSPAPATSASRLHCSGGQMGLELWHWAGDSSHFSLEHCNVCPSKAPVLSHGCKQPAVPRGSWTASTAPAPPHPAQSAHGFFAFLMEKELEANSLRFLCSKRETGKKNQKQQVGALGLSQTHPPVPELAPGLQQHSRQCQMDYTAWLKAEPGLCMTGGTELIQQ